MALNRGSGWLTLVVSLGLAISVSSRDEAAGTKSAYALLVLEGTTSRWPKAPADEPIQISYGLVDRSLTFSKSRNCRGLTPISPVLQHSAIPKSTFHAELREAFRVWEKIAHVKFRPAKNSDNADILIGSQAEPTGFAFTDVALTAPDANGDRHIKRALICLNPERTWKVGFDGNLEVFDLRFTLAHEIGHAIGLDHPGAKGQLMDFRYTESFREPQAGDIAGAAALYGDAVDANIRTAGVQASDERFAPLAKSQHEGDHANDLALRRVWSERQSGH